MKDYNYFLHREAREAFMNRDMDAVKKAIDDGFSYKQVLWWTGGEIHLFKKISEMVGKEKTLEFIKSRCHLVVTAKHDTLKYIVENYGVDWVNDIVLEENRNFFKNYCYLKNQIQLAGQKV